MDRSLVSMKGRRRRIPESMAPGRDKKLSELQAQSLASRGHIPVNLPTVEFLKRGSCSGQFRSS